MKRLFRLLMITICLLVSACRGSDTQENGNPTPGEEAVMESGKGIVLPPSGSQSIRCSDPDPSLLSNFDIYQAPENSIPEPRIPFRDPIFGTCLTRVTDYQHDLQANDPSEGLKNEYSRVQSFNADGSLILVRSIEANWYVYDARSLQPMGQIPLTADPRWDAADPGIIYYSDETRFVRYDIRTGEAALLHDFSSDFPSLSLSAVWTRYEGSPSMDTRYWGLMAQDQDWQAVAFLVYDRLENKVIANLPVTSKSEVDSVTISPSGNYFLAYFDYCEQGQMGTMEKPCGLMVYDRSLQTGRGLLRLIGHSDTALDAEGREVLVYQDIDQDQIAMLDLENGKVTLLAPIDYSHTAIGLHFSGRAFQKPGWAIISTYSGGHPTSYTWMDNQVFALELKAGGRVVRLAHTRSIVDENMEKDYWAEPHASASPDLSRILFTSNWYRSGSGQVEMYMIILPEGWEQ